MESIKEDYPMTTNNPFTTTFGREPDNMIERLEEQNLVIESFSREKPSERTYIITGQRGSGKTVLLSKIHNHFKEDKDFVVVDPGSKKNIIENIASLLYENGKMKKLFSESEFSFSFHGLGISIKGKTPISSAYALLCKMLEHLKKKGKRLLITIDEADNSEEMRYFIQDYQALLRQDYPIFLLMTGLYSNIRKLEDDKSLTFLYRAPKIPLGPLSLLSIARKYQLYLHTDMDKSMEFARLTKGYAYAYQVLGYLLYENSALEVDDAILAKYDQHLFDYVYEKIYSELTEKEREILSLFKEGSPLSSKEVCDHLGCKASYLSPYRNSFLRSGILSSPKYGYLELSLPRFDLFLTLQEHF